MLNVSCVARISCYALLGRMYKRWTVYKMDSIPSSKPSPELLLEKNSLFSSNKVYQEVI